MQTINFSLPEGEGLRALARFPMAAIALTATFTTLTASAQDIAQPTMVVTATRSEARLDETLADVRVITQQQMESVAGRSLAEVLQRFADVRMASNGGRGNTQSVYIRGSNKVIVLIDGVRYGSATMGTPTLEALPLEAIERIEVVHGPASALYGSDALGGVIQIFTKQGKGERRAFAPHASATWGSAGYKAADAGFAGAQNGWNYSVDVARVIDPGFSVTNSNSSDFDPDRDKFNQSSVTAALGYAFNRDWHLGLNFMRSNGYSEFDQHYVYLPDNSSALVGHSFNELEAQTQQIKLQGQITAAWKSTWSVGQSRDHQSARHTLRASAASYRDLFETKQTEYKWSNEIKTAYGPVIAGYERLDQRVNSTEVYTERKRTTDAFYLGWNGAVDKHSWQANVRHDDNSQFGSFNTWGVAYGYELVPGLRAHASRARSMKAPTFNDLYYPISGNPLLEPERGLNNELGLTWNIGAHTVKLLRFDNKVSNLIAWAPVDVSNPFSLWQPANVNRARLKGWSLGYSGQWQSWTGSASYQHLDAYDESTGKRMTDRMAEHQVTLNLEQAVGAWKWGTAAVYVGKRTDSKGSVALPSYTTWDAHVQYQLNPEWSLQARVANLTDKQYETAYGYQQRGRMGYITLKWAPR